MKKLGNLGKKLDFFSSPVELMIHKKRSHQSLFGAFMTLLMFSCVLTYIINKFVQLGQRKEFQTLYSEVYYEEIPVFPLLSKNFTLQFAFQTENQTNYIDESIYQVKAVMVNRAQVMVDNKTNLKFTKTEIPLSKCAKIGIPYEEIEDQLDNVDIENTYCLDWNNIKGLSLIGTPEQENYTYIYISFETCVNDTSNLNSQVCKSKEEIQEKLHRNYILFQLSSYNIDLRNYLKPNVPKVEEIQTTISSQVMKDITLFMQPITTLTEEGLLNGLVRKDSTIRYLKTQEVIDFNSDEALASVLIRLANTENISYRIYPKLQDILAQAGGLWEILMLVFTIMVKPIQSLSYKLDVINNLFNFEGQKQQNDIEDGGKQILKKLTMVQENIQTHENDTSIILNQSKIKSSIRFPKGRTKNKNQKMEQVNSAQTEKSSQMVTNSPENDKLIQKGIRFALRKLFNIATLKLRLSAFDYIKYLKCGKKEGKFKQMQYSINKLEKCLDILFIIDKLQEIDKLKTILLTKQQVQLFDFLPKPMISLDPSNLQQNETVMYSSLLKPYKSQKEKAHEAQQVLDELLENLDDPITIKLISLMDPNIFKLLQIQLDLKKRSVTKYITPDAIES
ncbi:unnamed protein product (macronuclear) [Paramecium tetraurelia]|uniref:Transmembrane protein n=1 Tax=Paramecium tetraurelia TaxID=5888 RepID=A0D9K6_PARTE|nr:uncharacterized protein GSPATT00014653001 [Paramecium tetraurelia]CAK79723.1 unnamed protein product [Paramecium tetraurelia]|eukprot:XP_001447120.1 hypothetical protein (macronuclear) [Paramecium tetraurelia strain d4-2]